MPVETAPDWAQTKSPDWASDAPPQWAQPEISHTVATDPNLVNVNPVGKGLTGTQLGSKLVEGIKEPNDFSRWSMSGWRC